MIKRRTVYENIRCGRPWTIESGSCAPELWRCEQFFRTEKEASPSAAELAREMGDPLGFVGHAVAPSVDFFGPRHLAEDLLAHMGEQIYELCGEAADDWPSDDCLDDLEPIVAMLISKVIRSSGSICGIDHVREVPAAEREEST